MKKLLLISMLIGAMPFSMQAQDDLYFVPKKKSVEKSVVVENNVQQPVSTRTDGGRSIDEYNRRMKSSYQVIDGDTAKNDIIDFSAEQGVYPDSIKEETEDFELTKKMSRFDDYQLADNAAFWAGYHAGVDMWAWHSPWYYTRYGWYGGWYDPWYSPYYYSSWRYGWYDPWYYSYYGWYDPWYYGYYGYPYYYGWNYPYWGGYYISGGGGGYAYHNHIGTGTIRSDGSTHAYRHGNAVANSSSRTSSLRDRASRMSGGSTYSSGNRERSNSGNFSGYRGNSSSSSSRSNAGSYNTGSYNSGSRNSGGSFGGSRSSGGGGGGGFSSGSRGGGGGGGSRLGGRR
jgi:hypothetical protein